MMSPRWFKSSIANILLLNSALWGTLVFAHSAAEPQDRSRTHQYHVNINKELSRVDVKICFDGRPPEYLAVDYKKATKDLINFPKVDSGHIEFQGRYWKTEHLKDNACIQYQSDISTHLYQPKTHHKKQKKISFQSDNTWLWLPESFSKNENAQITFSLPKQYQISTPWQSIPSPAGVTNTRKKRFEIGHTPHDWGFTIVIGELEVETIRINNTDLNLAILPNLKQKTNLKRWITDSFRSLNSYLGGLELSHLQIILLENKRFKKGPVPWGDVKRGGGLGVRFVVNSKRPIEDFYRDWTITHEFAHLLLPNIEYKDIWLSEGLASYLQYILMAQAGTLNEQQVWQKIYAGFKRGEKATQKVASESLKEATKNRSKGGRYGRTMRIYWSGAAYFLTADWQLREQSNGQQGLADVLLKLNRCCIHSSKEWSGEEFASRLDQLSQTRVFSHLYSQVADSNEFPATKEVLEALGINIDNGKVSLASGEKQRLRSGILMPEVAF